MIMEILVLIFVHLLADHPLQGQFLATMKGQYPILLVSHAGIWTGCIAITGYFMGYDVTLVDIFFLFSVHAVADYLKATGKLFYAKLDALKGGLLVDQLIHVLQIVIFVLLKG
jgi:hypothetical protein